MFVLAMIKMSSYHYQLLPDTACIINLTGTLLKRIDVPVWVLWKILRGLYMNWKVNVYDTNSKLNVDTIAQNVVFPLPYSIYYVMNLIKTGFVVLYRSCNWITYCTYNYIIFKLCLAKWNVPLECIALGFILRLCACLIMLIV